MWLWSIPECLLGEHRENDAYYMTTHNVICTARRTQLLKWAAAGNPEDGEAFLPAAAAFKTFQLPAPQASPPPGSGRRSLNSRSGVDIKFDVIFYRSSTHPSPHAPSSERKQSTAVLYKHSRMSSRQSKSTIL